MRSHEKRMKHQKLPYNGWKYTQKILRRLCLGTTWWWSWKMEKNRGWKSGIWKKQKKNLFLLFPHFYLISWLEISFFFEERITQVNKAHSTGKKLKNHMKTFFSFVKSRTIESENFWQLFALVIMWKGRQTWEIWLRANESVVTVFLSFAYLVKF